MTILAGSCSLLASSVTQRSTSFFSTRIRHYVKRLFPGRCFMPIVSGGAYLALPFYMSCPCGPFILGGAATVPGRILDCSAAVFSNDKTILYVSRASGPHTYPHYNYYPKIPEAPNGVAIAVSQAHFHHYRHSDSFFFFFRRDTGPGANSQPLPPSCIRLQSQTAPRQTAH